ncbi:CBS domain-containing protein [Streptomyces sp. NBC_01476]|uniref:CBS domain-containing protein n=1 Tax=Streptomyces sp. NBC_01476 TaxID=2903881 RepID=UPI002E34CC97|nr:CBS domain-containing protein [Streptomyces sp. NBC_01476]
MKHRKVGNVMTSDVVRVRETTPFKKVAALLAQHRISGVPVVDDDEKVVGVVSASDLIARQAQDGEGSPHHRWPPAFRTTAPGTEALTAGRLMSAPPVTVHADESIAASARTMAEHRVERLPVLDEEERLVGIVTRRDVLQVFLRPDADIREDVIRDVFVRTLWLTPLEAGVKVTDGVVTLEGRLERESDVAIAGHATARIDGVVAVDNRLTSRFDDSHLRAAQSTTHGVADRWLHRL